MPFTTTLARYEEIDKRTETVRAIHCYKLDVSGKFGIELTTVKGMKLFPVERFEFDTREEANEAFKQFTKNHNYKKCK